MRDFGRSQGRAPAWILSLLLVAGGARAEEAVTTSVGPSPLDLLEARVRYGVAVRSGGQKDTGPGLTYSGLTPNDLGLSAWGWFALGGHLGGFLNFQREAFALYADSSRITGGGLIRASIGPTGRLVLGPVRLEAAVGYAFDQLPTFGSSGDPHFARGARHGVLLAARGLVDLGPVTVEARGQVPIALVASDGAGHSASASGFEVGGAVRLQLLRTRALTWGLVADFTYSQDNLDEPMLHANQSLIRVGGAIDLKWQEEAAVVAIVAPPERGSLELKVVDAQSGAALPGAVVELGAQPLPLDAAGSARVGDLPLGTVTVRATLVGYLPVEQEARLEAGLAASLVLKLKKEPPKIGALVIHVVARLSKSPLARATVKVGAASVVTDEAGLGRFADLPPGPIGIAVTLDGYTPGEEAATVVGGQESEVTVELAEVKKRLRATINGLVRSTRGGKAIAANLEIPQLKIKTRASAAGAFSFQLDGGTYTVSISAPGYLPQSKSVTVKDGDQAIFNVDLHPK